MKFKIKKFLGAVIVFSMTASIGIAGCVSSTVSSASSSSVATSSSKMTVSGSGVEIRILAADSLSKAMEEAQELYTQQTGVTFSGTRYKTSAELNEMLGSGDYADIEITASKGIMDTAVKEGYVDERTRQNMFTNELVIVAKSGSILKDVTLQDIASSKYSVCLGDDSVPEGNYAAQALSTVGAYEASGEEAGMTGKEISGKGGSYIGINPVLQGSVDNICKQVEKGDVDVAIVYSSDVYLFDGVEVVGIVPDDTHKAIVYPGAVCSDSRFPEESNAFIEWCITDPDAQEIWNKWGFSLA